MVTFRKPSKSKQAKTRKLRAAAVEAVAARPDPATIDNQGWLKLADVERKKVLVSKQTWDVEVELQRPSADSLAIDRFAVLATFQRRLGNVIGEPNKVYIFEEPEDGGRYATGADLAKTTDWTVIETLRVDRDPHETVAWECCGRKPWPLLAKQLDRRIAKYGGRGCYDATGLGAVIGDYLKGGDWEPVIFQRGLETTKMLGNYILAIEHRKLMRPMITRSFNAHQFASYGMFFGNEHLPDECAAGALAWRACEYMSGRNIEEWVRAQDRAMKRTREQEEL